MIKLNKCDRDAAGVKFKWIYGNVSQYSDFEALQGHSSHDSIAFGAHKPTYDNRGDDHPRKV